MRAVLVCIAAESLFGSKGAVVTTSVESLFHFKVDSGASP